MVNGQFMFSLKVSESSRADVCLNYFHGYLLHSVIYGPMSNSFTFLQSIFQMCMEDADSSFKSPSQHFISMWMNMREVKKLCFHMIWRLCLYTTLNGID